jgi:hypothetical protein
MVCHLSKSKGLCLIVAEKTVAAPSEGSRGSGGLSECRLVCNRVEEEGKRNGVSKSVCSQD